MIKGLYTIHDRKTGYGNIITCNYDVKGGDTLILRDFRNMAKAEDTLYAKNPEDFSLVKMGEFDTITGKMEILEDPVTLDWLDAN